MIIIAGRRYGDWRRVATGCTALVLFMRHCVVYCILKDDDEAGVLLRQLEEKKREVDEG